MDSSVVTTSNIPVNVAAAAMKMIVDKANLNGANITLHGLANSPLSLFVEESNSMWVIAAIAVASLVAVGGVFFIRKRKEHN